MATIETIGAVDCDYTTPQSWYDAHKGDITNDSNAPYIGELKGTFSNILSMMESTCDSSHYFHLRAHEDYKFDGDFGGTYSYLQLATGPSNHTAIMVRDDYFRCEHICIVGNDSTAEGDLCGIDASKNLYINGCGFRNFAQEGSNHCINIGNYSIITNCIFTNVIRKSTTSEKSAYGIRGRSNIKNLYTYIYNNVFDACYDNNNNEGCGINIANFDTAYVINNIAVNSKTANVFTFANYDTLVRQYNGFDSSDNIIDPTEMVISTLGLFYHIDPIEQKHNYRLGASSDAIGVGHFGHYLRYFPDYDIEGKLHSGDLGVDSINWALVPLKKISNLQLGSSVGSYYRSPPGGGFKSWL